MRARRKGGAIIGQAWGRCLWDPDWGDEGLFGLVVQFKGKPDDVTD